MGTNIPVVICGAREPARRVVMQSRLYLAQVKGGQVAGLYSVAGLRAAAPAMDGIPVFLEHWQHVETEERPLLGWLRGPIRWDEAAWELRAQIEPSGDQARAIFDEARRLGWGFSLENDGAGPEVRNARTGRTVPAHEVFMRVPALALVERPSLGGRFA
jgi:hypothetical protein